jgi:homocysteine S-methyltransferase
VGHANFLHNEVPGIVIPKKILERMNQAGDRGASEGVQIAVELIQNIKTWAAGVYIMPQFNRFDLVADIISMVQ